MPKIPNNEYAMSSGSVVTCFESHFSRAPPIPGWKVTRARDWLMECLVDDIPSTVVWCLWVENQLNAMAFLLASWTHHWSTGRGISIVYQWRQENTSSDRNQVR